MVKRKKRIQGCGVEKGTSKQYTDPDEGSHVWEQRWGCVADTINQ